MYPANLFNFFPPFPRDDKVFVAMSFDSRFTPRWRNVIEPAIRSIGLQPYRVDARTVSDSILTDITRGIASARLIFADISAIGGLDGDPDHIVRNGNVMYEVGLAHAGRLPEEVIIFRDDDARLPFDVAPVRIRVYDPEAKPDEARTLVTTALADALKEIDLSRSLAVQSAVASLDANTYSVLQTASTGGMRHPVATNMGQAILTIPTISAIARLAERGMIVSDFFAGVDFATVDLNSSPESFFNYRLTEFGLAVIKAVATQLLSLPGFDSVLPRLTPFIAAPPENT